jgi:hypothetical protein
LRCGSHLCIFNYTWKKQRVRYIKRRRGKMVLERKMKKRKGKRVPKGWSLTLHTRRFWVEFNPIFIVSKKIKIYLFKIN